MTNTQKFAATELGILIETTPDAIVKDFVPEILALAEKFGQSGQSGGSAPYVARALSQAIESLCLQKPICPVTGRDEEWVDVSETNGHKFFQNSRCYALFKAFDLRPDFCYKPYYLDAIVWVDEQGGQFTGEALLPFGKGSATQRILSRQYIKGFPFTPKTFYVDVITKQLAKDDWERYVKNPEQLEEVFKYYNHPK